MADRRIGYLPQQLAEALRRWAPPEVSDSEMYDLDRLAERIWADGYDTGFTRGYEVGRDTLRRPNINDVNRLREAIAATTGGETPMSADKKLPDLKGFAEYHGLLVAALGDDGDVLIALGHHDRRRAVAAFNRFVRREFGWTNLGDADLTVADALDALKPGWGVLLTECGDCSDDRGCWYCDQIKEADWWIRYGVKADEPGAFPVTTLEF